MNSQIENVASSCQICSMYQRSQIKEHEVPKQPWAKVGADLHELSRKPVLLNLS